MEVAAIAAAAAFPLVGMLRALKFLDQKQGEARVVDHREVVREKLEAWLASGRPTAEDLAARGILGRGARLALARAVVDALLRNRAEAREEARARIPAGTFTYTEGAAALLGGTGGAGASAAVDFAAVEWQMQDLVDQRRRLQGKLDDLGGACEQAARACENAALTVEIPKMADGVDRAVSRLGELHTSTGSSLAGVFVELAAFRKLLARRRCLEVMVDMVEKTDKLRDSVFKASGSESLPLHMLDDLPTLCARLPSRSRVVGVQRVQFLISPIHATLVRELQCALLETGRWPLDAKIRAAVGAAESLEFAPCRDAAGRVVRLCAELVRAQRADCVLKRGADRGMVPALGEDFASWAADALSAPLLARFRYHFCRPDSELCRMDKPEWAFKFLEGMCLDHCDELRVWLGAMLRPAHADLITAVDLPTCLAIALAREAALFVRARMPLLADASVRADLFHTIGHLVRLRGGMAEVGGDAAAVALFADFDANRPLQEEAAGAAEVALHTGKEERAGGLIGGRLTKGVSGAMGGLLANLEQGWLADMEHLAEAVNNEHDEAGSGGAVGFLDVWASADASFVTERLSSALADGAAGWKPRACSGVLAPMGDVGAVPEAAELATLASDLFAKASERAECLKMTSARRKYSSRVLDPGLRQVLAAVRMKWNALVDPLREGVREAALLVETLEELCRFMFTFTLGALLAAPVDDANALRLGILGKLSDLLESVVQGSAGRLCVETCVFSVELSEPVTALRRRLRPTNFKAVLQRVVAAVSARLFEILTRQQAFSNGSQMEIFVANCRDDLRSVLVDACGLDEEGQAPLRPLWDGCALLALSPSEAAATFAALRQVRRCAPAGLVRAPWREAARAAEDSPEAAIGVSDVVLRTMEGAMQAAGVQELSVDEAALVLGRRPELAREAAGDVPELFSAGASALQDLSLGALQLGSGGGALLRTATAGAAELRSFFPGRRGC